MIRDAILPTVVEISSSTALLSPAVIREAATQPQVVLGDVGDGKDIVLRKL